MSRIGFVRDLSALLCVLMLGGCGPKGPEIASVTGKVTIDGKPLVNATVVFIPENGRPAGGRTNEKGEYVLNFVDDQQGAIPGKNAVRITTKRDAEETPDGKKIPAVKESIPSKYGSQSTLTFDVVAGKKNVANFDLTSGGPVDTSD